MKTLHEMIMDSTEFAAERIGIGEKSVTFFAPITRIDGTTWIHPTYAKEFAWEDAKRIASKIWEIRGSLWNPTEFRLVWSTDPKVMRTIRRLSK